MYKIQKTPKRKEKNRTEAKRKKKRRDFHFITSLFSLFSLEMCAWLSKSVSLSHTHTRARACTLLFFVGRERETLRPEVAAILKKEERKKNSQRPLIHQRSLSLSLCLSPPLANLPSNNLPSSSISSFLASFLPHFDCETFQNTTLSHPLIYTLRPTSH